MQLQPPIPRLVDDGRDADHDRVEVEFVQPKRYLQRDMQCFRINRDGAARGFGETVVRRHHLAGQSLRIGVFRQQTNVRGDKKVALAGAVLYRHRQTVIFEDDGRTVRNRAKPVS